MPTIQPDFTEVVSVAPGVYPARIVNSEIKTSQAGNDYVRWTMEIFGVEGAALGGKVWDNTMVKGRGAGRLKSLVLAATGEEHVGELVTESLHGREVEITVVDGKDFKTGQLSGFAEVKAVRALN